MLFDSLMLAVAAREIEDACRGDRVQRIIQPSYTELYLAFRCGATVCLSAAPDFCRVHLAAGVPEPTVDPTPFCQALRKHLEGAVLVRAEQLRFDRVLFLHFSNCGGFGPEATAALVAEPTGRLANMMLLDTSTDGDPEIIACAKHVTRRVNRYREVLPGEPYVPPPPGDRLNPRELELSALQEALAHTEPEGSVGRFLAAKSEGASSFFLWEVLCRAALSPDASVRSLSDDQVQQLHSSLTSLARLEVDLAPAVYQTEAGRPFAYPIAPRHAFEDVDVKAMPSLSAAVEEAARRAAECSALRNLKARVSGAVRRALKRARAKLRSREQEWARAEDAEREKRLGELILAQATQIPGGASEVELVDLFDPEQPTITVELDPLLTPTQNAQQRFQRYRKARAAQERLPPLIEEARREVEYLEGLQPQLEMAQEVADLKEMQAELAAQGYLKPKRAPRKPAREQPGPRVRSSASPDGYTIYYGRTNAQNEHLLRHLAGPDDLWLHVQGAPGAHVVVKRQGKATIPQKTVEAAARIAAQNSQLRSDGVVPVDYTRRKYVTKPKGSKPGFVHYTHAKTILVRLGQQR